MNTRMQFELYRWAYKRAQDLDMEFTEETGDDGYLQTPPAPPPPAKPPTPSRAPTPPQAPTPPPPLVTFPPAPAPPPEYPADEAPKKTWRERLLDVARSPTGRAASRVLTEAATEHLEAWKQRQAEIEAELRRQQEQHQSAIPVPPPPPAHLFRAPIVK